MAYGSCCDDHQDCHQKHPEWKTKTSQAAKKEERRKLNLIQTIEPDQINRVTQDGRWEGIELAVDSGATETVMAESTLSAVIDITEGGACKRGVTYEVANGEDCLIYTSDAADE